MDRSVLYPLQCQESLLQAPASACRHPIYTPVAASSTSCQWSWPGPTGTSCTSQWWSLSQACSLGLLHAPGGACHHLRNVWGWLVLGEKPLGDNGVNLQGREHYPLGHHLAAMLRRTRTGHCIPAVISNRASLASSPVPIQLCLN